MKRLLTLAIALAMMFTVKAGNKLSLSSITGHPGDEVEVVVSLENSDAITAVQIELPLDAALMYVDSSALISLERIADHQMSVSYADNKLKIYIYSLSLASLNGNSGELLRFKVLLGKEPGDYSLSPSVVASNKNGTKMSMSVSPGTATLLSPKITTDKVTIDYGSVPIRNDYQAPIIVSNIGNEPLEIIDIQLSSELIATAQNTFTIPVGGSQKITITYSPVDYGVMSEKAIIHSNAINGDQTIMLKATPFSVNELFVGSASGKSGSEVTISLSLNNMEPIVATQCNFILPDALQYVDGSAEVTTRTTDHQVVATSSGNKLTFYMYSLTNSPLNGNSGDIMTFRLRLNGNSGTYQLTPENVILSNIAENDMTSLSQGGEVRIWSPRIACAETLAFGDKPVEETATAEFIIKNDGETDLTIERIIFSDSAFSAHILLQDSETIVENIEIPANDSRTIIVSYIPSQEGPFSGTMQIYSDDPENRMKVIEINGNIYESNYLTANGTMTEAQKQYTLNINLINTTDATALQFDIHWLKGMTLAAEDISLSDRATEHQVALTQKDDSTYRVFIYSLTNTKFENNKDDLLSLTYNKMDECDYLKTLITLDNIIISTADGENKCTRPKYEYTALSGIKGDVNSDGNITITDVVGLISHSLGLSAAEYYESQEDEPINVLNTILEK